MSERNTVARIMHDVGLAAWFGGSLMGAIGVNGAAADVDDARQRARVANAGWSRWTPVNLIAIGAHVAGAAQIARSDSDRIATQKGVATMSAVKTALTVAALGTTAYARVVGDKMIKAGDVPVGGGTTPISSTPGAVAAAQKKLAALQWAIPGLTGALVAISAYAGEQQRPSQVAKGVVGRAGQTAAAAATKVLTLGASD